jgi:hypothetical protein
MTSKYKNLKEEAFEANLEIPKQHLAIYTWGNVSALDRAAGVFAIKPSGVPYDKMNVDDMVIVDLDGKKVEGKLNPSSDTPTHAVLYRNLKDWVASAIRILPMPSVGHRQDFPCPCLAQPMLTISVRRSHAPVHLAKRKYVQPMKKTQALSSWIPSGIPRQQWKSSMKDLILQGNWFHLKIRWYWSVDMVLLPGERMHKLAYTMQQYLKKFPKWLFSSDC